MIHQFMGLKRPVQPCRSGRRGSWTQSQPHTAECRVIGSPWNNVFMYIVTIDIWYNYHILFMYIILFVYIYIYRCVLYTIWVKETCICNLSTYIYIYLYILVKIHLTCMGFVLQSVLVPQPLPGSLGQISPGSLSVRPWTRWSIK